MNPDPQQGGLLGFFQRMRKPNEQTGLSPFQRFGAALDPLILPEMRAGQQIREQGAQRVAQGNKNKTIQFLQQKASQGDTVAAQILAGLENNSLSVKDAMSLYYNQAFAKPKESFRTMTGAQVNEMTGSSLPKDALFNVSSTGKVSQVGGGGQTIQIGGPASAEEEFYKKKYERLGTEFAKIQERAGQAGANNLTISALRQLYQVAPFGPVQGRLLELFPEATDVSAAVQSLRTQLAPQLRVEGSGSTSDIEYSGMLNSLGSLKNSPEANTALLDIMLVKNEIIQTKADIATRVGMPKEQGGLTINEAEKAMLDVDRQMWSENSTINTVKQLIENAGGFKASSDGKTITTSGGLTVEFE